MPNDTLNDKLSWEAIGLLAYLCSKPANWRISITQLINHSQNSNRPSGRDKTYTIMTELMDAGYVCRIKKKNDNNRYPQTDYYVSPSKITDALRQALQDEEKPLPDNQEVVKLQLTDNQEVVEKPLPANPEVVEKPLADNQKVNEQLPDNQEVSAQLPDNQEVSAQLPDNQEVSAQLPDNQEVTERLPDNQEVVKKPLPDLTDPDEPTLQIKKKKKKEGIASEKKALEDIGKKQLDLLPDNKPAAKKPKTTFSPDFLKFWEEYPKSEGSKVRAWNKWKVLSAAKRKRVMDSLPLFKGYAARQEDRYVNLAHNYIKDEIYENFQPVGEVLEPVERVFIDGQGFSSLMIINACKEYLTTSVWDLEPTLGPAPDNPNTKIPKKWFLKARKLHETGKKARGRGQSGS